MAKIPLLSAHEIHLVRQVLRQTSVHNLRMEEADKELLMDMRRRMFAYLETSYHPYWAEHRKRLKKRATEKAKMEAEEAERKRVKDEYRVKLSAWHALCKRQREIRKARSQARKLAKQNHASKPT